MNTPSTQLTPRQRTLLSLGAAIVGLALLFVFEGMFDVFTMQIFKLCAINVILALSLNLINGFTGLFSLGHAGFMAVDQVERKGEDDVDRAELEDLHREHVEHAFENEKQRESDDGRTEREQRALARGELGRWRIH
jgi:hypothetical protein